MYQNKTIEWEISQEHIDSQNPLGFKVELSEDESHKKIAFIHNTFDGVDNFTYETSEGTFLPYPQEGLLTPVEGKSVKLPYELEKLMRFIVTEKDGILHRISPDGVRILDSIDTEIEEINYLSVDELRNNIWVTTNGIALVFQTPFKSDAESIQISEDCLAVIVDGFRKAFWEITLQELILKEFDGEIIKTWSLPFDATKVLSHQILPSTGGIYLTIETSDPEASSTRYLVFCEFAGNLLFEDDAGLDEKIGCITKLNFNSVLTGGNGSLLTKWTGMTSTAFANLITGGVNSIQALAVKEGDTIYLVNENNLLMAFDGDTLLKQWEIALPGTTTKYIQPMFEMEKDKRVILFVNDEYSGATRDLLTSAAEPKSLEIGVFGSNSLSTFGSINKVAIAYIRISTAEEEA